MRFGAKLKAPTTASRAILVLALTLTGVYAHAELRAGAITAAYVQNIIGQIQDLRGLKFEYPVRIAYLNPEQVGRRIKSDTENEKDRETARLNAEVGTMLGLLPKGFDPGNAPASMLKLDLGGFYDLQRKELVIVETPAAVGKRITAQQMLETSNVVAHELTHALQDQHFAIGTRLKLANDGDDDRSLALRAVVEGDATLAAYGIAAGRIDNQVLDVFVQHIPDMERQFAEKTRDVPWGVREPFIFQYMSGARFVAEAYHRRGWNGVNALYAKPPQSTQQILHPPLYFDSASPPPQVHIAGYENILSDWTKRDESPLGEFLLRIILQSTLGHDTPFAALADSWSGDSAVVLTKNNSTTVLWMLAFADEESAASFVRAYSEALDRIHGARTPHRVERNSRLVLVMVGDGAAHDRDLLPEVWRNATVTAARSDKQ